MTTYDGSPKTNCPSWRSTIARSSTTRCSACSSKIEYSDVATRLLGPTFTLRQLHGVYEAIGGEPLDLANFRRKMLASGDLEDTGEKMREGRQRPATVYRYIPKRPVENGTPHESDGDDIVELSRQGEREDALDALIPSARI